MPQGQKTSEIPPPLFVRLQHGAEWSDERSFTHSFTIGRASDCDVVISERVVSRYHAEVRWQDGVWQLRDMGSHNGTYVDGVRIQETQLPTACRVELGGDHIVLWMTVGHSAEAPSASDRTSVGKAPESVTKVVKKWLDHDTTMDVGPQTKIYREAMARITRRLWRRYSVALGIVGALLIIVGVVAWVEHKKIEDLRQTAEEMFYAMKQLELQVAQLKEKQEILAKHQAIKLLESKYDKFVDELGLYADMSEQDRAVLHVARLFGECEAAMPKDFQAEVKRYIQKWKSTRRLHESMERALEAAYIGMVSDTMSSNNLPPQFFYVALQESGFDHKAIGPKTRRGFAKGMWQFVASTAKEYGLRIGPLQDEPRFDPNDDRFNPKMATEAAAKYIKRIYLTDAQASGLLVMASYNWGEGNVIERIRQMPENPKERNFWQLLKRFKIPQETYDYVLYIISAAVIGENPQLFGFNFPAPFPKDKTL
ncbi:MAG: FHA domain-containing protein [Nitrospira sp.]